MVTTATILAAGKAIDVTYEVLSIFVRKEVNRIPTAELKLLDGSAAEQKFEISDTATFEPGAELEIKLRYEGESDESVFKGVVVRHGVEARDGSSLLAITAKDEAVKLTGARRNAVFEEQKDHEVIAKILSTAGITKGTIATTTAMHPEIVQYRSTDWDFIVSRADINGLLVVADAGEVSVAKIEVKGSALHTFEFGIDPIYEFEMEIDGASQSENFESVAWDPKSLKATQAKTAKAFTTGQGNLKGDAVAKKIGTGVYTLATPTPLDAKELQAWADGRLARNRMAMIRGRVSVAGIGSVQLLDVIEIKGVGKRFNGKTLVTGLAHRVSDGGWVTDIQFGLSPEWFATRPGVAEVPAAGLLPPAEGLQVGIVGAFEEDPDGEFRVRVQVPGMGKGDPVLWARLAAPDAGNERGWFFRPEVGDEVVVGFLGMDPRRPVVLGALYGSKNTPPKPIGNVTDKNVDKGLVTQSGTVVHFVDGDKPQVTIATPAGNTVLLDDDGEAINLTDQHGNSIAMTKDGIELKSAKDLVIDASGAVNVKSGKETEIKPKDFKVDAAGNVEIKGAKVDVK